MRNARSFSPSLAALLLPTMVTVIAACSAAKESPDLSASGASAETATGGSIRGYYGKCLDDYYDSQANGAYIDLYSCNGSPAQTWTYTKGTILGSGGKCLDVSGANSADGTKVELWDCNGGANHQWQIKNGEIVGLAGKCLEVVGPSGADATPIDLRTCNGSAGQQWQVASGAMSATSGATSGATDAGSASTGTSTPSKTESASCTTLTGASGMIVDASGAIWTLVKGADGTFVVDVNGAAAGYSDGVATLAYVNHVVSQENQAKGWWSWKNAGWSGASDPTTGCSAVTTSSGSTSGASDAGASGGAGSSGGGGTTTAAPATGFHGGVNLSGPEFAAQTIPGVNGTTYTFPTHAEIDYYVGKGLTIFRLPFLWERLEAAPSAALDPAYLAAIQDVTSYIKSKGAITVLDPHDYARYNGGIIGAGGSPTAADFANLWSRLATIYANDPSVIFGLMNEPHDMDVHLWLADANAAIAAIRATGAGNVIFVPGDNWTGAHLWGSQSDPNSNASVMLGVVDPKNNYVYEVHQYLDADASGTSDQCASATIGADALTGFTAWLKANGKRGFLGEFAGARNDLCYTAIDDMLDVIDQNRAQWFGWTWWVGGIWYWDYMFNLEPSNGQDRPQMAILQKHL